MVGFSIITFEKLTTFCGFVINIQSLKPFKAFVGNGQHNYKEQILSCWVQYNSDTY